MRAILTLAQKDFRNLVTSPLFYIIASLFTGACSLGFLPKLLEFAGNSAILTREGREPSMNLQMVVFNQHVSVVNFLLIFVIPALTMRMISEEKRMGTFDLLLTSPVTATQIALGKFLAGFATVAVLIFLSFLYPLLTRVVADYPMGPLLTVYLGLTLMGALYVGIGLFASSLTESVILSVVMGLIFNILLYLIPGGISPDANPTVAAVMQYLSVGDHFRGFAFGSIQLKSVVFLVSMIALFVFFAQRVIESERWR